jgi:hypothetical protein
MTGQHVIYSRVRFDYHRLMFSDMKHTSVLLISDIDIDMSIQTIQKCTCILSSEALIESTALCWDDTKSWGCAKNETMSSNTMALAVESNETRLAKHDLTGRSNNSLIVASNYLMSAALNYDYCKDAFLLLRLSNHWDLHPIRIEIYVEQW